MKLVDSFRRFSPPFSCVAGRCGIAVYFAAAVAFVPIANAQLQSGGGVEPVRVTVSMNDDGSHTAYEYDVANHKAVATTTGPDGKTTGTIRYELDDAGRFAKGEVLGADGQFRFKTVYKYDLSGRLSDETQLTKAGAVKLKLVYSYDGAGKQSGYSVYDADGKLLGRTKPKFPSAGLPPTSAPAAQKKSR